MTTNSPASRTSGRGTVTQPRGKSHRRSLPKPASSEKQRLERAPPVHARMVPFRAEVESTAASKDGFFLRDVDAFACTKQMSQVATVALTEEPGCSLDCALRSGPGFDVKTAKSN